MEFHIISAKLHSFLISKSSLCFDIDWEKWWIVINGFKSTFPLSKLQFNLVQITKCLFWTSFEWVRWYYNFQNFIKWNHFCAFSVTILNSIIMFFMKQCCHMCHKIWFGMILVKTYFSSFKPWLWLKKNSFELRLSNILAKWA